MESVHHEQQLPLPVVKTVRDRIIAFHDRYLKVVPIAEDTAQSFEDIVKRMTSKKGQAVVERIRPHITDWSKNAEVWASTGDMVLSVAGSVLAAEGLVGGLIEKHSIEKAAGRLDLSNQLTGATELKKDIRPRIKRGFAGAALSGIFGGLRPISRLTYRIGIPIARRVALTADRIMLKKEQKLEAKQVFVGRGKA